MALRTRRASRISPDNNKQQQQLATSMWSIGLVCYLSARRNDAASRLSTWATPPGLGAAFAFAEPQATIRDESETANLKT